MAVKSDSVKAKKLRNKFKNKGHKFKNIVDRFNNIPSTIYFFVAFSLLLTLALSKGPPSATSTVSSVFSSTFNSIKSANPILISKPTDYIELSNFYARYTNGNRQFRGMKIAHFNKGPGHLVTKKHEIKFR